MANSNPFDFLGLDDQQESIINPRIQAKLGDLLKELDVKPAPKPAPKPPKQDNK
ncbi:MAG: hypothetical protein MJ077_00290 [Oscillospiraceae bacterium]|nr:hypothetical protein [Oscillospiraceae bacterium]